jgi:Protein of unknown function (DUF3105)
MASRKEQKERLRQERLEREQAQSAADARRKRMGYAVAGVLVAAVVVALIVVVAGGGGGGGSGSTASAKDWPSGSVPKRKETDLAAAASEAGCVLKHPKSEGRGHITGGFKYKTEPPTSGAHDPEWAHDGAYLKNPGVGHLVHGLEHGRVIIWFKPSAPANVKGSLKKLFDEDKALMILTPNSLPMPYQVAATAWTQMLGCPSYNDKVPDAIRAFRDAYRLKGPEFFPNAE